MMRKCAARLLPWLIALALGFLLAAFEVPSAFNHLLHPYIQHLMGQMEVQSGS